MGGWVKIFNDATTQSGSDLDIAKGESSWSKGPLSNIKEVFLYDGLMASVLEVPDTDWYQFNRYTIILNTESPSLVVRCVQAEVKKAHVGKYLCYNNSNSRLVWAKVSATPVGSQIYRLQESDIGRWITIILAVNKSPELYWCPRGNIRGSQQIFK